MNDAARDVVATDHSDDMFGLCASLAAGSIEPRDRQRLAEHLAEGCLECEVALADFEQVTLLLAAGAPSSTPAPDLRDRVLRSISAPADAAPTPAGAPATSFSVRVAQMRKRRRSFSPPPWTAVAVAALFGFVSIIAVVVAWQAQGEIARLHGEITGSTGVVSALNNQLQQEKTWGSVLASPDTRWAELRPVSQGDVILHGRAAFDPESRRAVFVFENLTPISDRSFQLWAVIDRTPRSLGLIRTDERGNGVMRIENAGDPNHLNGFQVTLEKPGGSAGATPGSLVMSGHVGG